MQIVCLDFAALGDILVTGRNVAARFCYGDMTNETNLDRPA
jgi:hypothetical protein